MKKIFFGIIGAALIMMLSAFYYQHQLSRLSLEMTGRTLQAGKYFTTQNTLYYDALTGDLVTNFTLPVQTIVFTNAKGEYKIYDPKENTVMQDQGASYSSKQSFIYQFLNGKTQDMGLKNEGFTLKQSKVEDGLFVTEWTPPMHMQQVMKKIELVHEKNKPIYMAVHGPKSGIVQKVYYSNYQQVAHLQIPFNITEYQYLPNGDSLILQKKYTNPVLNQHVDDTYFQFKIPANAKVLN